MVTFDRYNSELIERLRTRSPHGTQSDTEQACSERLGETRAQMQALEAERDNLLDQARVEATTQSEWRSECVTLADEQHGVIAHLRRELQSAGEQNELLNRKIEADNEVAGHLQQGHIRAAEAALVTASEAREAACDWGSVVHVTRYLTNAAACVSTNWSADLSDKRQWVTELSHRDAEIQSIERNLASQQEQNMSTKAVVATLQQELHAAELAASMARDECAQEMSVKEATANKQTAEMRRQVEQLEWQIAEQVEAVQLEMEGLRRQRVDQERATEQHMDKLEQKKAEQAVVVQKNVEGLERQLAEQTAAVQAQEGVLARQQEELLRERAEVERALGMADAAIREAVERASVEHAAGKEWRDSKQHIDLGVPVCSDGRVLL